MSLLSVLMIALALITGIKSFVGMKQKMGRLQLKTIALNKLDYLSLKKIRRLEMLEDKKEYINIGGVPVITFCNTTQTPWTINSYDIQPDNIVPNENVTISIDSTLTETVTDGTVVVKVTFQRIPVITNTTNLCDDAAMAGQPCPITAGDYSISQTVAIGNIPIQGNFGINIKISDQNSVELICMDIDVSIPQ